MTQRTFEFMCDICTYYTDYFFDILMECALMYLIKPRCGYMKKKNKVNIYFIKILCIRYEAMNVFGYFGINIFIPSKSAILNSHESHDVLYM